MLICIKRIAATTWLKLIGLIDGIAVFDVHTEFFVINDPIPAECDDGAGLDEEVQLECTINLEDW